MIRYTCSHCRKSLKASEAIIGRKAKCTRCGVIDEVPPFSTRKSRARQAREEREGLVSVDSDSFFGFDDLERLRQDKAIKSIPQAAQPADSAAATIQRKEPTGSVEDQEFRPLFKRVEPKRKASQKIAAMAAGLLILFAAAFILIGSAGFFEENDAPKTEFDQTKEMIEYENALFELKKAQRVMVIMSNGYLSAKGVEKSELGDLDEFVASLDQAAEDETDIVSANELFESGNAIHAKQKVAESTKKLNRLRQEVARRTKDFQQKTYQ